MDPFYGFGNDHEMLNCNRKILGSYTLCSKVLNKCTFAISTVSASNLKLLKY